MTAATMINTLKATVFPQADKDGKPIIVTDAQLMMFLEVCSHYQLNPFVKEIYAFPTKGGGIVPMVPVDGWANIVNRNPNMDGVEFEDEWEIADNKRSLISTTCTIHRKDRKYPTKVTEYLQECYQSTKQPWVKWPARMLRHKAYIQCARIAFALAGIYDPDEAERIAESEEPKKEPITRPSREIEGTTVSKASPAASSGEAQTTGAVQAGTAPVACLCECCKDENCSCVGKSEFDACGCEACKRFVSESKQSKVEDNSAKEEVGQASQQVTGQELFPQAGQPVVVYAPHEKLKKLFAIARSVWPEKMEEKLHEFLAKYNIKSAKEIPLEQLPALVEELGKTLKAK
jgi:phage recombination protein Bet